MVLFLDEKLSLKPQKKHIENPVKFLLSTYIIFHYMNEANLSSPDIISCIVSVYTKIIYVLWTFGRLDSR